MTKIGKRLKSAREGVNREKFYSVDEAVLVPIMMTTSLGLRPSKLP